MSSGNKNFKKLLIGGALAGAMYYALGAIAAKMALTRSGLMGKIATNLQEKSIWSRDDYRKSLDRSIDEGMYWFELQDTKILKIKDDKGNPQYAHLLENKDSHNYAFVIHGYTSSPQAMGVYAKHWYEERGFNVVLPSLGGHGLSEDEFISMGWIDRLNILKWINFIVEKDKNAKIFLHGVSMGAATVMMTTGEELPENVKCAVEDCGYTSVWDILSRNIEEEYHLPKFPFLYSGADIIKLKEHVDLRKASSVEQLKKSKTPTLFIHGADDTFVPYEMLDKVYEAAACEKEKITIPDAPHARSAVAHPELYWAKTDAFVDKYLK